MLAPLKNRAILEKEPADGSHPDDAERLKRTQLEAEISSLRQALRESRAALRCPVMHGGATSASMSNMDGGPRP
jgi:hypothetical protein